MLAAPAAPLITQCGSALFLFFVLLFSSPVNAENIEQTPENPIQQVAVAESASINLNEPNTIRDLIYQRSHSQRVHLPMPLYSTGNSVMDFVPELPNPTCQQLAFYNLNCTDLWYKNCCFVRAGPLHA